MRWPKEKEGRGKKRAMFSTEPRVTEISSFKFPVHLATAIEVTDEEPRPLCAVSVSRRSGRAVLTTFLQPVRRGQQLRHLHTRHRLLSFGCAPDIVGIHLSWELALWVTTFKRQSAGWFTFHNYFFKVLNGALLMSREVWKCNWETGVNFFRL